MRHIVGVGRGLVGIFGTHQPLARPLFLLLQGGWLNSITKARDNHPRRETRSLADARSWGLCRYAPLNKPVTFNQSRDNNQSPGQTPKPGTINQGGQLAHSLTLARGDSVATLLSTSP